MVLSELAEYKSALPVVRRLLWSNDKNVVRKHRSRPVIVTGLPEQDDGVADPALGREGDPPRGSPSQDERSIVLFQTPPHQG